MKIVRKKQTVAVKLTETTCHVAVSRAAADAYHNIIKQQKLFEGTKLLEVMEAIYRQGQEDGQKQLARKMKKAQDAIANAAAILIE